MGASHAHHHQKSSISVPPSLPPITTTRSSLLAAQDEAALELFFSTPRPLQIHKVRAAVPRWRWEGAGTNLYVADS